MSRKVIYECDGCKLQLDAQGHDMPLEWFTVNLTRHDVGRSVQEQHRMYCKECCIRLLVGNQLFSLTQ